MMIDNLKMKMEELGIWMRFFTIGYFIYIESIILHKFLFKFDIVEKELLIILDIFILFFNRFKH